MINSGIYVIVNLVNNKFYIGRTKNFNNRKTQHFSKLRLNKHGNKYLQNAYNKYGEDNFIFLIYERFEGTIEELEQLEKPYLEQLVDDENCYNLSKNSSGPPVMYGEDNPNYGLKFSKQRRLEMSLARIGKNTGEDNPFWGKKHTEESKEKMSISSKGKTSGNKNGMFGVSLPIEKRYWLGKKIPDDVKRKISNSRKGQYSGNKNHNFGKEQSKEIKNKNRKSQPNVVPIIIDDIYYDSLRIASKILNIPRITIHRRVKNSKFPNYQYADEVDKIEITS